MRIAVWLVVVVAVAVVLSACGTTARSPELSPGVVARGLAVHGVRDLRAGPAAADPAGLGRWAVRSWQIRERYSRPVSFEGCLQVGLERGGSLVRLIGGRVRVLAVGERSVCGALALGGAGRVDPQTAALLVERVDVGRSGFSTGAARTLVAGILPSGVSGVSVRARGRVTAVSLDARSHAFLAVLPGVVRRQDVSLSFRLAHGRQRVDFATGRTGAEGAGAGAFEPVVPGSLRTAVQLSDALSEFPLALVVYRLRIATVHGEETEPCGEPAELVGGEAGAYNAYWQDFLDAPTLIGLSEFTRGLGPVMPAAQNIDSCLSGFGDYTDGPFGALGIRRINARLVAIHGFLAPGLTGLRVIDPSGNVAPVRIDPLSRAFLAAVPSRGRRGEQVRLRGVGGHPRVRAMKFALGDQPTPQPFRFAFGDHRRTIKVSWASGFEPFIGAQTGLSGRRLTLSVLDLYPPSFVADGTPGAIAAVAISKCANIHLTAAVPPGTRIIDAATRREIQPSRRLGLPRRLLCTNVRPGQSVNVSPEQHG